MESKVYIVMGDTGEYSDTRAWYLKAFTDEAEAKGLCGRLNIWLEQRGLDFESYRNGKRPANRNYNEKPLEDPDFQCDYTGSRYSILELPLEIAKRVKTAK